MKIIYSKLQGNVLQEFTDDLFALTKIKKELVKSTYECDKCKKDGDITNMVMIIGKGLFHAKCLKSKK